MKESSMLAINRLLNLEIPSSRRENLLTAHTVMSMSPSGTTLVIVEDLPGEGCRCWKDGKDITDEQRDNWLRLLEAHIEGRQEVVIPRKQLLSIITELQSDQVRIKAAEGHPLVISGMIEDCTVRAAIAYVIEED